MAPAMQELHPPSMENDIPLEREMITPRALTEAAEITKIYERDALNIESWFGCGSLGLPADLANGVPQPPPAGEFQRSRILAWMAREWVFHGDGAFASQGRERSVYRLESVETAERQQAM